jgi:oligoribonuclease NrnB/cAMP/cGMP phosphodiesterase (DHH superfamily)
MKPLVIYHADCTDGFAAAFAAWLKLGDEAEYLPMQYNAINSPIKAFNTFGDISEREVYILDFSFPREVTNGLFSNAKRVVWLDHHKSAFEMWCGEYVKGMRHVPIDNEIGPNHVVLDDNKSGALLAWEYFHPGTEVPMLIRHIDDRDRWQFKLEGSKELHAALASLKPWSFEDWRGIFLCGLFEKETWRVPEEIYMEGAAILRAQDAHIKSMLKQARKCRIGKELRVVDEMRLFGLGAELNGLALNTPMHMSEVGHELANQSSTYGLVWYVGADGRCKCSLRSNGDYDVSALARAFGGGGHRNAAGFETDIETLMGWLE